MSRRTSCALDFCYITMPFYRRTMQMSPTTYRYRYTPGVVKLLPLGAIFLQNVVCEGGYGRLMNVVKLLFFLNNLQEFLIKNVMANKENL